MASDRIGAAVVGGGVVGLAVLLELAQAGFGDLFLFEKSPRIGDAQSGRNSGVIHAGVYYRPGSLKAALCVEGNALLPAFCAEHGVPWAKTGKLIVASTVDEVPVLEELLDRARANGAPGVELLTGEQARRLEPNVRTPAALHCPSTGIVDAAGLTAALGRAARAAGARILTNFEVTGVEPLRDGFAVTGTRNGVEETIETDILVNAAGLASDRVARWVDPGFEDEIAPLRGEYVKFNRRRRPDVGLRGMNVYPVPETVELGGRSASVVGVHLTPTFALQPDGSAAVGDVVTVGPEFVAVADREDLERGRKDAPFFLERARRFFPGLTLADLEPDFAGIMAKLRDNDDFIVRRDARRPACVQLVGIDSPGLTSALALARRVRALLTGGGARV